MEFPCMSTAGWRYLQIGLYRASWPQTAMGFNMSSPSLRAGLTLVTWCWVWEYSQLPLPALSPRVKGNLPTRTGAPGVATSERHSSTTDPNDQIPSHVFCLFPSVSLLFLRHPINALSSVSLFSILCFVTDRLCGLVLRVLGYRSGGPGSIPGTTKKK
jgi:hypothetical protein